LRNWAFKEEMTKLNYVVTAFAVKDTDNTGDDEFESEVKK
jgi:hypothetical protein